MATFTELVKEKIEILDNSPERFTTNVEKAQLQIWKQIEKQFDKLDTKDGIVLQTSKNMRVIRVILKELNSIASEGEYMKSVESFLKEFDQAAKVSVQLQKTIEKSFKPSEFAQTVQDAYKETAIEQLFSNPLSNTATTLRANLVSSIASKSTFTETIKSAREIIVGGPDTDGRMLANIKTVATTSIAVSDSAYSAVLYEQMGNEWFRYVGGDIDTTRPFCRARDGKYFHRKEIEAWGNGEDAGDVGGIKDDGTWDGEIEGTDSRTIFSYRGGWNCRHAIIAVPINSVPKEVIDRNIANGNYKPKK